MDRLSGWYPDIPMGKNIYIYICWLYRHTLQLSNVAIWETLYIYICIHISISIYIYIVYIYLYIYIYVYVCLVRWTSSKNGGFSRHQIDLLKISWLLRPSVSKCSKAASRSCTVNPYGRWSVGTPLDNGKMVGKWRENGDLQPLSWE